MTSLTRAVTGAGGIILIASLFLPWADERTGWEMWTMADLLFLVAGGFAVMAAVTGGAIGVFRPDVSLVGAADLLNVISTLLLVWLVAFDFPEGADREPGVFLALAAAGAIAAAVGDYRVFSGAPVFPKLPR
jgi:hypothetical protein